MNLAPIVLFVYNRPDHTKQTIEALQKNELAKQSELFIYSDEAKNEDTRKSVEEVRTYISKIEGFKKVTVIKREKNWGLADSIIDGVTKIVNEYGKIIVLEDDLITSPYFLKFMNENLEMYQKEKRVASIHGYVYPIDNLADSFFIKGADCWGWATWENRWAMFEDSGQKLLNELRLRKLENEADFNGSHGFTEMLKGQISGKNNSWAVRWYMSAFLHGMLTLYPGKSYVMNIGNDDSGTHCGSTGMFTGPLYVKNRCSDKITVSEDYDARRKFECFFSSLKPNLVIRVITAVMRLFK